MNSSGFDGDLSVSVSCLVMITSIIAFGTVPCQVSAARNIFACCLVDKSRLGERVVVFEEPKGGSIHALLAIRNAIRRSNRSKLLFVAFFAPTR